MSRLVKLAVLGAGVVAAAAAAVAAYRGFVLRPLPSYDGQPVFPELDGTVDVLWDQWGVPHIYAQSQDDAFFVQGYLHAQDRLWQMELNRRAGAGRLSELFGQRTLEADRFLRRVGLRRVAREEFSMLDEDAATVLAAYCAGVNAFIRRSRSRLPLEFTLLRFVPEPWSPVDVLQWAKLMGWNLSVNWDVELLRAHMAKLLGADAAAALEQGYQSGHPLTSPPGAVEQDAALPGALAPLLATFLAGGASNAWAISGERSASGKPLLANDPHLNPGLPSPWYECHLECPDFRVTGVSLPGAPGIVVGHNQQVAWGMTASMVDTQDIFMERLADDGSPRYRVRNAWRQGEVVHEVISVKGKREPEHEQVLVTPHGPVVLRDTEDATVGYALRSTLLEPGSPLKATRALLQASSVQEAQEALAHWTAPALNFVLADVHGNIGYQLAGTLPRREPDSGVVPAVGWEQQREWQGHLPPEDNPALLNPPEGYVVNANNKVTANSEPYIAGEWVDGYRAQRIADLLLARPRHSVADFQAMHQDALSLPALQLIHMLVDAEPLSQAANQGMEMLLRWDARIGKDSPQAALYETVRLKLHQNLLRPVLGERVQDYFGVQVHPLGASSGYLFRGGSMLFRLAERLRSSDKDAWHRLLTQSFEEAFADLYYTLGPNMQSWSWGGLHTLTFRHTLGALPIVGRLLNRGPYPLRGDTDTVHQASFTAGVSFEANRWIPGFRYVADTSDWDRSVVINVPGQSGQVGSPHYDDQIEMWLRGEYRPMLFSRAAVEAGAQSWQQFLPE